MEIRQHMADSEHGCDAPALSALAASRWLFETSSHVPAGFEDFSKEHSWPGGSRRDRFSRENRIRMSGHGPAQMARRVFVAPDRGRRAPARSATCPTCSLPGRTCNRQKQPLEVETLPAQHFPLSQALSAL